MNPEEKKEKSGVAKIRERFQERMRNWKPSPELEEAIKQKKPLEEGDKTADQPQRKIANPKRREDLDL
jgi:hypothetical protein